MIHTHKFTATGYDAKGRYVRYYRGITRDYRVSGSHADGYTVHAEAWMEVNQQAMYRVILCRNLVNVWKKINLDEARTATIHGETIYPRTMDTQISRAIDRLTAS